MFLFYESVNRWENKKHFSLLNSSSFIRFHILYSNMAKTDNTFRYHEDVYLGFNIGYTVFYFYRTGGGAILIIASSP